MGTLRDRQSLARAARLALAGAVAVYTAGFLLWYSATPLGLYPVLDGREMLDLARRIAGGALPAEPFYRAPLYPAVLALMLELGLPQADLAFAARMLNGALHLASTALVWSAARGLWASERGALLAASLFGLNPMVLHFAADPLDITLAMTLMLGAVVAALRAGRAATPAALATASLLFAVAALTRPQLMAMLCGWWLLLGWRSVAERRADMRHVLAALLPALLACAAMAAVNLSLGGEARVLPWQGAFNLWAANHAGANGRYFEQSRRLVSYDDATNPARLEAERLYREARPGAPAGPAETSRYWRGRALAAIGADPAAWLRRVAAKAWYLLNNFEQYNNKTYVVHKARSPWLAPNPLCWSLLLTLGVLGATLRRGGAGTRLLAALVLSYVAALLLTYVSARFRLPLVPLLAILAGGVGAPWRARAIAAAALAGAASLLPLPAADTTRTFVQDDLLLSRAALLAGDSAAAEAHAREALARAPGDEAARELLCVARFNHWLRGKQENTALAGVVQACERAAATSPVARRALALAHWRRGETGAAAALLEALAAADSTERDAALAALLMTGLRSVAQVAPADGTLAQRDDVLLLALALHGDARAAAVLRERMPPEELEHQAHELARTFGWRAAGGQSR